MVIPNGIKEIGHEAFKDCTYFERVTIEHGVTDISGAFSGCMSLTSVTIPNSVAEIDSGAFEWCGSLVSVTIPGSVTEIGDHAFFSCKNLKSVTILRGVEEIGYTAFLGCDSLESVVIPRSVTEIGYAAFSVEDPNFKIQYDGTKAQWEKVKLEGVDSIPGGAVIQCNDGDIVFVED